MFTKKKYCHKLSKDLVGSVKTKSVLEALGQGSFSNFALIIKAKAQLQPGIPNHSSKLAGIHNRQ